MWTENNKPKDYLEQQSIQLDSQSSWVSIGQEIKAFFCGPSAGRTCTHLAAKQRGEAAESIGLAVMKALLAPLRASKNWARHFIL